MKKIKEFKGIIIIIFTIILGAFYWYELRPMQIRKNCNGQAYLDSYKTLKTGESFSNQSELQDRQEKLYRDCLRYKGIKNF